MRTICSSANIIKQSTYKTMNNNNQCNHVDVIARDMYTEYCSVMNRKASEGYAFLLWDDLTETEQDAWRHVADQALPVIGKHAMEDIKAYLGNKAATATGWKKPLYWIGAIIAAGLAAMGISVASGCSHSVDITPQRTEIRKDGSILILEQGHLSFSQSQPETDISPIVQPLSK